ncbi:Por secretion system C-terminal sorting domain-containing protein [Chryseobacterium arachidis]|uniref:Por secretion system C-terminal sorting domain-containing protein n=1 Tax=Chryseobacterium arachidis TaxID=1416778 RepID=A0A1M5LDS6_9FLAO|nr:peptide-N-glycosidase F-related protein [Chryseobacterium arachidis]SHG62869.1 Por secretion system C-terminal sorting domain-containing protein [Chryseobacterium arachidis]
MKQKLLSLILFCLFISAYCTKPLPPVTVSLYQDAVFYDMYAATVNQPLPTDAVRLSNSTYTRKMTDAQLDSFGNQVTMNITIGALCDNYDRLAHVTLAFVPKGATSYDTNMVKKLEIGRFVTPFMNKNISPTSVPYTFQIDNLGAIFKDANLRSQYDYWIEFSVFGVPYAAQTQVAGCAARIDTFKGSLSFVTDNNTAIPAVNNALVTMAAIKSFNNYNATDEPGTTLRMLNFTTTNTINNANFYLITSNHGANSGGEEYVRRQHYVYLNDQQIFTYKPGGISCEPFRQYNTQGNGIYGSSAQSTAWWTSWNNWCPGNSIPIRKINLGNLEPGFHTFMITVPDAQFVGQQGDFPLSVYLQGEATSILGTKEMSVTDIKIYPNPTSDFVKVASTKKIRGGEIYSMEGRLIKTFIGAESDIRELPTGNYVLKITFDDGLSFKHKIVKK